MALNTKIPQQIVSSTTTALSVKRGESAMIVADLEKGALVLMDGKTYGGIPAAREDVQIRAGSDAITVNGKEWAPLLGNIDIGINPSGFIENVVSPTDKVLGVGVDGKIAAQLSVSYDETTGLFSLKGKDGEIISSFTLVIPTGITPKSVALVENPESQEPGLYLEFVFIDDDDVEIKLYANMDVLKDVYTAGRGITISDDRVISVDEDAISGVIADDLIEENSGLKVVNDKLHLDTHASETPEYGLGDLDHYGHVRLADSGDSRATVQAGIAATPAAVKDVDDRAVHNEGDEIISGVKTFVDTPKVNLPGGGTDDVATLTDVQMLVDGTVWNKRVDSIPEDTDAITADMPVGGLVVTSEDFPASEKSLAAFLQPGGGIVNDVNNKIYVDFSSMPTDKFEKMLKSLRLPIWLTANTNFYVDKNHAAASDMLDEGRGLSASKPFKTIQACVNYITEIFNVDKYVVRIIIADGEYEESVTLGNYQRTTGHISLEAANVGGAKIITHSTPCLKCGGIYNIVGLDLYLEHDVVYSTTAGRLIAAISASAASNLTLYGVYIKASILEDPNSPTTLYNINTSGIINIQPYAQRNCIFEGHIGNFPSTCRVYGISANAGADVSLTRGNVSQEGANIQVWGEYWTFAIVSGGYIHVIGTGTYNPNFTVPANKTCTGTRYSVYNGGKVSCDMGAEWFPGNKAGSVETSTYSWYK